MMLVWPAQRHYRCYLTFENIVIIDKLMGACLKDYTMTFPIKSSFACIIVVPSVRQLKDTFLFLLRLLKKKLEINVNITHSLYALLKVLSSAKDS